MHIVVCCKQVLDQEIPPRAFRIDRAARRPDVPGAAQVLSIFDGNALETALKLREAAGGGTVTALTLGEKAAEEILRKALAVTADQAVLVSDPALVGLDPAGVSAALAAAVRHLEPAVDVVLCGRQAGDWEHGQTGGGIAERLGWPCVSFVSQILPQPDGSLRLRREVEDGYEELLARPPLVATVTNGEQNVLRLAKVKDVMQAHRKPILRFGLAELGLDAADVAPRTRVLDLFIPEKQSACEFISADTPADQGRALARRLRELKLV